ncbi:serine/threonine-protein kinase [Rhizobium sp. RU36D]|uniref:serine/threonine-protein kinase n=1 Tax=Rhizobium sp. RU36D TaxID=1907415 RepID=UPI0009D82B78|nr:serine/threonine-protein kinase [Rhizobium sp. RU36D]SMD04053.1 serine/threonine protein kinase [Rhizobium sp. RU36D]
MNVMNADWQMVQDLFEELVDAPPAERERRMAAYAPSPEVMAEALALFAANEALSGATGSEKAADDAKPSQAAAAIKLEPDQAAAPVPAPEPMAAPSSPAAPPLKGSIPLGTMLGAYRIKALITKTERGELYSARRADGAEDGRVMVRLLPIQYVARFDAARPDRQLLIGLEHPAIARLLQGGKMPDGRPYLVSDFVEGEELLAYVKRKKLSLANRLRLMLDICAAVGFGHRNLMVHQDIKPSHIMVTPAGKIRLVDFGLAPMLGNHAPNEERAVSVSTEAYAAPEYLKGARATVVTDVYALGAVLFELLTGVAPWMTGGKDSSPSAARLLNNEPLSASTVKAVEPTVVPIEPTRLIGDLDAILAKAMRYDPAHRYESVSALSEDILRAMAHRPVVARRGGMVYRAGRFLRRNRLALIATAAIAIVGGGATFGAGSLYLGARGSDEQVQLARVETARDLMTLVFRSAASGQVAGFGSVREVLDRTVAQVESEPANSALSPDLLLAVGSTFLELEEYDGASTMLQRYRASAEATGDAAGAAQANLLLGAAAVGTGDNEDATLLLDAAQAYWQSSPRRYLEELAMVDGHRATLLGKTGRRAEGIAMLRDAIARLDQVGHGQTQTAAFLQQNLGVQLMEAGQLAEAGQAFDKATATLEALGRANAPIAMTLDANKALLAYAGGNWAEAAKRWEEAISRRRNLYGPSDALAATTLSFGRALLARGEPLQARLRFNDALSMTTGGTSQSTTVYAMLLQSRGLANLGAGDLRAAEQDLTQALDVAEKLFGEKSLYYGMAVMAHAEMSFMRRDIEQARQDIAIAEPIFAAAGAAGQEQQKALMSIKKIIDAAGHISG